MSDKNLARRDETSLAEAADASLAVAEVDENPYAGMDLGKVNMLSPVSATKRIDPFHVARLSVVHISSDPNDGDVYNSRAFMRPNERALTKQGLLRISKAAGLCWVPGQCGLQPSADPDIVIYKAVGFILAPDGRQIFISGMKEIDCRDNGTEASLLKAQIARGDGNEASRKRALEEGMVRLRQHRVSNAETKAKLRVLREVMAIKSKYTVEELKLPFIVPHVDKSPNFADPMVREVLAGAGREAVLALFGFQSTRDAQEAFSGSPQSALTASPTNPPSHPPVDSSSGLPTNPQQLSSSLHNAVTGEVPDPTGNPGESLQVRRQQAQRRLFGLARQLELEPSGDFKAKGELVEAMRERFRQWVETDGEEIVGWKKDGPSIENSTLEQLMALGDRYSFALNQIE